MSLYPIVKPTKEDAMEFLELMAGTIHNSVLRSMAMYVILDLRFATAPGGSSHHHNYTGGLAEHVAEVVWNCEVLSGGRHSFINRDVLLTAAFWHDYMKVADYKFSDTETTKVPDPLVETVPGAEPLMVKVPKIEKTDYLYLINHVTGSALEFNHMAITNGVYDETRLAILHCLLSHHGRNEWGSPVEPKTPEAWLLHAADMLSAQPLPGVK